MFKEFELTFPPACAEYIQKSYAKHHIILEYGAGGSTVMAARAGKTVITTETDPRWLIELIGAAQEQQLPGRIIPIHADIGSTKEWGYPVDSSQMAQWPAYADKSWRYINEHDLQPDLILIDGRFRVASFLTCCARIRKTTTLLFDDYMNREHYHSISRLFTPIEIIGERMAIFRIKPKQVTPQFLLDNFSFFLDPR